MVLSLFAKLRNKYFQQFIRMWGREPQTPKEWMTIQDNAVRELNKTKGVPGGPKKPPFQGWKPEVIQGGKGIESLLKSGDVKVGVAPKTTKKTLADKKDRHILFRDAEEDIARIKRENKQAIEDFKKKHGKKTVEDFRDEGDWDPGGFAGGGVVKKFIERLFIKASNDIRQGKGKWKGLTQDQWIKQHDDLTKMMKKWEWGGKKKLPPGAEEYLGMNDLQIARAVKLAEKQAKHPNIKLSYGDKDKRLIPEGTTEESIDEAIRKGNAERELEDFMTEGRGVYQKEADEILKQNEGLTDDEMMQKAYDEIKGGSGFTDDYKMDADLLAEQYALQKGKVYTDLPQDQISIYYNPALKRVSQDMLKRREAKKALKDVEQKIELQMFDTTGKKPHAEGGRASLMYGGDPGFAFEYGGSWADWHDQHRDQMPIEQYIKTKLPKHRLPFREMNEGGIARAGFPFGGQALKAIRAAWRANKDWGVGGPPYKPEKTSFNIKEMTKRNLGKELSLTDLRRLSESPLAGPQKGHFEDFNRQFKNIKAQVLREKMMERKLEAKAMIHASDKTMKEAIEKGENLDMAKKITGQMKRESKEALAEAKEGLKEIDIYMGMLQKKGRSVHQSGGLAYMLGEPTYMKYSAGGSVGHAPWHKPTGQQQPQPQLDTPAPQIGGAQSPGRGQPNPMKVPQGLPSVAPRTMDPAYMQQQMMQRAMMGQQGQQRMGMEEGGMTPNIPQEFLEDFQRREYHEFLDKYRRWQEDYERRKDLAPTQEAAEGGRIGFGLGSMSRRAFMKMLAGAATLPFIGKGVSKVAPKAIKEVTETITRDASGIPTYAYDLIEVVKAKGVQEIIEGVTRKVPATKYSYKGVDVTVHPNGLTEVRKTHTGPGTWTDEAGETINDDAIHREVGFDIKEGEYEQIGNPQFDDAAKTVKLDDEYFEATVRPDSEGKLKDMEEIIDEVDHLDLKKIADEKETLIIKKASGGVAHLLGE